MKDEQIRLIKRYVYELNESFDEAISHAKNELAELKSAARELKRLMDVIFGDQEND